MSKSDAVRALTLADVREIAPPEVGPSPPADVVLLSRGLQTLRYGSTEPINCGDGAAPFRILLTQSALRPQTTSFTGSPRLGERPHGALVESLQAGLGAGLRVRPGQPWPWLVQGTAEEGSRRFIVRGAESSQFATSLLLGAARRVAADGEPWRVELEGPTASAGYLDLTLRWLAHAGFTIERAGAELVVRRGPAPASLPALPADWSSAGYLLAIAWRSGGEVANLDWDAPHPDRAILRLLREVGLVPERVAGGATRVHGSAHRGLQASAKECPDLIPTLAALACTLPASSELRDLEVLRHKESDRAAGILELLRAIGAKGTLSGSRLIIEPPSSPPRRFAARSQGDHRLAMAAATAAVLLRAEVEIDNPDCVQKSFPGFFGELSRSGAIVC